MDRFANPLSIILLTVSVIFVGAGLISVFNSMLHDTENPSRTQATRLAAGTVASLVFWLIVVLPFVGTYTTNGSPRKTIRTLTWPLGIGVVGRGSFVEIVEGKDGVKVGLVLGLGGDSVIIKDGRVKINGQDLAATKTNLPTIEPMCALDVRVPSQSILVVERFISSWVDGNELACGQFVTVGSWDNVRGHLFSVTWPWELFGLSRIDLTVAEK
jgi:hypothetical protein